MVCDFRDLYDYGGESDGVGHYCLMCYGGADKNPVHVSAYLKNEAGWTSRLTTLTPGSSFSVSAGDQRLLDPRQEQPPSTSSSRTGGRPAAARGAPRRRACSSGTSTRTATTATSR